MCQSTMIQCIFFPEARVVNNPPLDNARFVRKVPERFLMQFVSLMSHVKKSMILTNSRFGFLLFGSSLRTVSAS